jgi:hypothetical protein
MCFGLRMALVKQRDQRVRRTRELQFLSSNTTAPIIDSANYAFRYDSALASTDPSLELSDCLERGPSLECGGLAPLCHSESPAILKLSKC